MWAGTDFLKLGTTIWDWSAATDIDSLCEQAEIAERLGLHSLWLPENHFRGRATIPAPQLLLAAAAARTTRIKLGCVSYLLPIRNPLLAAVEIAVLDQLCNGRLILGLGRGIQPEMFGAFGIESRDKRDLFGKSLDRMRRAWAGENLTEGGNGRPVTLAPSPTSPKGPRLWAAAMGPKALRQIAELALPYLASPIETLEQLKANYDDYNAFVEQAGHHPVDTVPVMRTVFIDERPSRCAAMLEAVRKQLPPQLQERAGPLEDIAIIGSRDSVRDQLAAYREQIGVTHLIVRAGAPGLDTMEQVNVLEQLALLVDE